MNHMTNSHNLQIKLLTNGVLSTISYFGFDIQSNEKQHKITLNSLTFAKPNPKAFEVIVHFLLCQLDHERAHKVFSQCWPQLIKEQAKEFKEIVFSWLSELASCKQQKFNSCLQYIKFPNVTKSLLVSPGGLKICELLFALSQYVLLHRLLKQIEANKLNIRVWPKVSAFTSSLPLSNISNENKQSNTNVKLVNSKQLAHFEIQRDAYKNKIDFEFNEFICLVSKIIEHRTNWLKFTDERVKSIRDLIDKKAVFTQAIASEKAKLAARLNLKKDECTLEKVCEEIKQAKHSNFESKWSILMSIKENTLDNEVIRTEIENTNIQISNQLELNGNDFMYGKSGEKLQVDELSQKLLKYLIDKNASIKDAKLGDLFQENDTKLDMINLIRLFNMSLLQSGDLIGQINTDNLCYIANAMNKSNLSSYLDDDQLFDLSLDNQYNQNIKPKQINEKASELKKKLDLILDKYAEKSEHLFKRLLSKLETDESYKQNETCQMIENYFKFCNEPTIDYAKLSCLKLDESHTSKEECENSNENQSGSSHSSLQVLDLIDSKMNDFNSNNLYIKQLIANLNDSIQENNLNKFKIDLNEHIILKPNLINQLLFRLAAQNEICEFVEYLMRKIHLCKSHFVCTDNICKLIVNKYILQKCAFTQYSVCFLLRCYDVNLIIQVLDLDLLVRADCESWYLMFVASYQERFFTHSFDDILESFLARYILICKLRCNLNEKRAFLTWFCGSLHLYCDEFFIRTDEIRFKTILSKLFEALILNGLLTLGEFTNLYQNLIKRNEELLLISSFNFNNSINCADECKSANFLNLDFMFPLSLKNITRLAIKRSLKEYTQKSIFALPLPNCLKKFLYFDSECDCAFKTFFTIKNV